MLNQQCVTHAGERSSPLQPAFMKVKLKVSGCSRKRRYRHVSNQSSAVTPSVHCSTSSGTVTPWYQTSLPPTSIICCLISIQDHNVKVCIHPGNRSPPRSAQAPHYRLSWCETSVRSVAHRERNQEKVCQKKDSSTPAWIKAVTNQLWYPYVIQLPPITSVHIDGYIENRHWQAVGDSQALTLSPLHYESKQPVLSSQ